MYTVNLFKASKVGHFLYLIRKTFPPGQYREMQTGILRITMQLQIKVEAYLQAELI